MTFGGSAGLFTFPDGARRPIGSVMVRHRALTFRVDHREEIASATALRTEALAEGVDVCLVRPVRPVDVLGQCRALMAMAGRIAGAASSRRLAGENAPSTNRPRALVSTTKPGRSADSLPRP